MKRGRASKRIGFHLLQGRSASNIQMKKRSKPYFWCTWLAPLLAGSDSCEYKVWLKAHHEGIQKLSRDFDAATYNENHTALLNEIRDDFTERGSEVLVERRWKIEGKTATVAGSIDLVTLKPNLIIDAKSGREKDSHVEQVKIYLLAVELGAVHGVQGRFEGLVKYPNNETLVPSIDQVFKERFFTLVRNLASEVERAKVPSKYECQFCDIADCDSRWMDTEETVFQTVEF